MSQEQAEKLMGLTRLRRAERRAVEKHRWYLSEKAQRDVGFEHAARDWLTNHADAWRKERQVRALTKQREEILKHRWIESEKAQRDVGKQATLDWIRKHAAAWRDWYEREGEPE